MVFEVFTNKPSKMSIRENIVNGVYIYIFYEVIFFENGIG